jgi:hypothetical protein
MNQNVQSLENETTQSKVCQMISRFFSKDKTWTWYGALFVATMITLVLGGILAVAIYWIVERVDTEIRAEFTASQFSFVTNRDIRLSSIKFQSIQVNEFANITLYPLPVEASNESSWQSLEGVSEMSIIPEKNEEQSANIFMKNLADKHCGPHALPMVTIPEGDNTQLYNHFVSVMSFMQTLERKPCGKLNGFIIPKGSKVTLQANPYNPGEFNVIVGKEQAEEFLSPILVSFQEPFQLTTTFSQIIADEVKLSLEEQEPTFIMTLDEDEDPYITITSQSESLELRLSTFPQEPFFIFSENDINFPFETPQIFVVEETPEGNPSPRATLLTGGEISYTKYPDIESIPFKDSDIIRFGIGGNLKMEKLRFLPKQKGGGIEVRLRGTPQKLTINETFENRQDRRLTYYDTLKENEFLRIVIDYFAWGIPLIIAIMGLMLIDNVRVINKDEK